MAYRRRAIEVYDVIPVPGGFVVERRNGDAVECVGRDGLWVSQRRNAAPFRTRGEAESAVGREQKEDK